MDKSNQTNNILINSQDEKKESLGQPFSSQQPETNKLVKMNMMHPKSRFDVIDSYFKDNQQKSIPLNISNVIVEYDYPLSYAELYRNVLDGLELTETERDVLKFEDQNFFKNLYEILKTRKTLKFISSISKIDIVRYDLSRLIYKWFIYIANTFKEGLMLYFKSHVF